MREDFCSGGCGNRVRYLSVRLCRNCLVELAEKVVLEPIEPYAHLLPAGQSFYDPQDWPLPAGCIWTADMEEVEPPVPVSIWA